MATEQLIAVPRELLERGVAYMHPAFCEDCGGDIALCAAQCGGCACEFRQWRDAIQKLLDANPA